MSYFGKSKGNYGNFIQNMRKELFSRFCNLINIHIQCNAFKYHDIFVLITVSRMSLNYNVINQSRPKKSDHVTFVYNYTVSPNEYLLFSYLSVNAWIFNKQHVPSKYLPIQTVYYFSMLPMYFSSFACNYFQSDILFVKLHISRSITEEKVIGATLEMYVPLELSNIYLIQGINYVFKY